MNIKELRKNSKCIILLDGTLIEDCIFPVDIGIEAKPLKYWSYNIDTQTFTFDQLTFDSDIEVTKEVVNRVVLKNKQEVLIEAYKSWENRVIRNLEASDSYIDTWYSNILNLDVESFNNIPIRILFYLSSDIKNDYGW